jgi:hypothetical protein
LLFHLHLDLPSGLSLSLSLSLPPWGLRNKILSVRPFLLCVKVKWPAMARG